MDPRNNRSQIRLHVKNKITMLSSKLQPLTHSHELSIKYRLAAKKGSKSTQNHTSMISQNNLEGAILRLPLEHLSTVRFTTPGADLIQETNQICLLRRAITRKLSAIREPKTPPQLRRLKTKSRTS